jgi:hypothetical protein
MALSFALTGWGGYHKPKNLARERWLIAVFSFVVKSYVWDEDDLITL